MEKEAEKTLWPLPKFHFLVNMDGTDYSFQEVSGLEAETQAIEYRHGSNKQFSKIKMPGIAKVGNVTLKKGVFVQGNNLPDWYSAIQMRTIKRMSVIIQLLDEAGTPTMTWTLKNAWPTKIQSADLKSDGNEVAIETMELAYEGLVIVNQ